MKAIIAAVLAAVLYAINVPCSKILLEYIPSTMLAGLMYLGAGAGMLIVRLVRRTDEAPVARRELPYAAAMVVLDIAAPVLLMLGLTTAAPANVSLLGNFEIVATSVIALCVFREKISARLWLGIALVTVSSAILSFGGEGAFSFSTGSLYVLLACVCWGFENNCTRKMSGKDPVQIVVIKGFGSGIGAVALALITGERCAAILPMLLAFLLGFVAFGLSITCYIYAQRALGAAKTSAYYAVAPFIGSFLSFVIFRDAIGAQFVAALVIMIAGTYFVTVSDK